MTIMTIPLLLICTGIWVILQNLLNLDDEDENYEKCRTIGMILIALGFALLMIAGVEGAVIGFATIYLPIIFTT